MKVVYLTTPGSSIRRRGDLLQVWQKNTKVADLKLFDVDRLVLLGSIQVTTQALSLLLDRGIDVVLMTSRGRLRGTLASSMSRNVFLRLAQFRCWSSNEFRVGFSQRLLTAKLSAQRTILNRYERNHRGSLAQDICGRIDECLAQVEEADSLETLRGLEGTAAAAYFHQFACMLRHNEFPGRKKRPSTDPVNALLSLGYVILTNEIVSALEARGLDPAVSFLHGLRYGRQSLALDMVEPFRQPVIDRLTLRLFNRRQFKSSDFEGGDGGLRLGEDGLKDYLRFYEEQLRAPSGGKGSPIWRERINDQIEALRGMVMEGKPGPFETWAG